MASSSSTVSSQNSLDKSLTCLDDGSELPLLPPSLETASPLYKSSPSLTDQFKGILLTIIACVFFGSLNLCVRIGTTHQNLTVSLFTLFHGIFSIALALAVLRSSQTPVPSLADGLTISLRGLTGSMAMVLKFQAVSRLPLSEATAIIFTSPAITLALTYFFLADSVLNLEIFASIASLSGAILISFAPLDAGAATGGDALRFSGAVYAALSSLCLSISYVLARSLGKRVHSQWHVLSLGIYASAIGIVFMRADFAHAFAIVSRNLAVSLPLLIGSSFCLYAGGSAVNRALQLLSAGSVSVMRSFDIPLAYLLAFVFLGELPRSCNALIGSVVIIISTVTLGWSRASKG